MQIDVPSHIEKLLFLHESLVIPGFGGFTATRTPATTDFSGGTVSAASKTLAFNENLTVDDGLLIGDITMSHGISQYDAQRVVAEFVEKMQTLLNQREIVTLPGVGRLYKNYVQKIQFLPDTTNFNPASYALPPLQFSPITRAREVSPDLATQTGVDEAALNNPVTIPAQQPPVFEQVYAQRRRGSSPIGVALGVILLLGSLLAGIWYWQNKKEPDEKKGVVETPVGSVKDKSDEVRGIEQPVNESESEPTLKPPAPVVTPVTEPIEKTVEKSAEKALKKREARVRDVVENGILCVVALATLSDMENVVALRTKMSSAGYSVYTRGKYPIEVGVKFYYSSDRELEDHIETIKEMAFVRQVLIKQPIREVR
jgi:cell division septation protein DedD